MSKHRVQIRKRRLNLIDGRKRDVYDVLIHVGGGKKKALALCAKVEALLSQPADVEGDSDKA